MFGRMVEWFKMQHWKCCVDKKSLPRVQIPLFPHRFQFIYANGEIHLFENKNIKLDENNIQQLVIH